MSISATGIPRRVSDRSAPTPNSPAGRLIQAVTQFVTHSESSDCGTRGSDVSARRCPDRRDALPRCMVSRDRIKQRRSIA
jgi:hypothetical protein